MKINGIEIKAQYFAYDGCHKIYLIESDEQKNEAEGYGYTIYPIANIQDAYENSCSLKFISSWDLNTRYVRQFEDAVFEGVAL